jgi:hypothetical protein
MIREFRIEKAKKYNEVYNKISDESQKCDDPNLCPLVPIVGDYLMDNKK